MPLSIMDRLADTDARDLQPTTLAYERKFKASIQRDLTALLNTRRAEADFDPNFEHSVNSVLTFGIVDFTALNLTSSADQERVRYSIERAIRQFEPRLSRVNVTLEEPNTGSLTLRFRIEATVQIGNRREDIAFPVALHRDLRRVAVSGEAS